MTYADINTWKDFLFFFFFFTDNPFQGDYAESVYFLINYTRISKTSRTAVGCHSLLFLN